MSFKKKISWHIDYRKSKHWPGAAPLRTALIAQGGVGELNFRKLLDSLKQEHGTIFSYIYQWPIFVSHGQHTQTFFCDFLIPKLKLCIEIDGPNHSENVQESWDERRSDLIRTEGFFIARYDWLTIEKTPELVKADLLLYMKQTGLGNEVSQDTVSAMQECYKKVSRLLCPVKHKGKRKNKTKVRLDFIWTRCKLCNIKKFHVNDGKNTDPYCRECMCNFPKRDD